MKKSLAVMFIVILSVGFVNAQSTKFTSKGLWELGGNIGFTSVAPDSNGLTKDAKLEIKFQPFFGYFIDDNIQIGFIPGIDLNSKENSKWTFNILAVPAYYIPVNDDNIFPYVRALAGYSRKNAENGAITQGFTWGVGAGAKYLLSGNTLVNVGFDYIQYTFNGSGASKRTGKNDLSINAGVSYFWK